MDFDFNDVLGDIGEMGDALGDLFQGAITGDLGQVASSAIDFAGEAMEVAAPAVSLFNPAAGAALQVGGKVLDALEDGKITFWEAHSIGQEILDAYGLGNGLNTGLDLTAGVYALAEKQVQRMLDQLTSGEGISGDDIDILSDLINLLNSENMKKARGGKGGGPEEGGGAEAGGEAGGSEAAGGAGGAAGGGSIFELIAEIFGKKMKQALGDMIDLAGQIDGASREDVAELTPKFTAAAQEFSYLSQSFNTGINALGEGLKAAARKQ